MSFSIVDGQLTRTTELYITDETIIVLPGKQGWSSNGRVRRYKCVGKVAHGKGRDHGDGESSRHGDGWYGPAVLS